MTLELVAAELRDLEVLGLTVLVPPGGAVGLEPLLREPDGPAD
jgi:hypothetical protein